MKIIFLISSLGIYGFNIALFDMAMLLMRWPLNLCEFKNYRMALYRMALLWCYT